LIRLLLSFIVLGSLEFLVQMSIVYGFREEALYRRGNSGQPEPCNATNRSVSSRAACRAAALYLPFLVLGAGWRTMGRRVLEGARNSEGEGREWRLLGQTGEGVE